MSTESDQLLVERIRRKDERAWESLVSTYEGRLRGYLRKRLADSSVCEDLVQETFLGFLTSLPNFDSRTPVESFLFTIASHKLTDHLRRSGRRPAFQASQNAKESDGADGVFGSLTGSARHASSLARSREQRNAEELRLKAALEDLIGKWVSQREFSRLMCIELLFVRGWKNQRVATELGMTEQDVANHKSYVLRQLQKATAES